MAGGEWHEICARLSLGGMVRSLAQHCELVELGEMMVRLRLPPAHVYLLAKPHQDKIEAELQRHFGRPLRLDITLADTTGQTPAERNRDIQRERQNQAIAAIEQDDFVRNVVDMFDATIDESTIRPIN